MINSKKIQGYIDSDNISEGMKQEQRDTIGEQCIRGYDVDLNSRKDLDELNKKAMKLAKQTFETKSFPWPDAANVKYPLITVASIQFASRALPELIPDEKITNMKVLGEDPEDEKKARGDRVSQYMDWQLTEDMDGWLDAQDRMLHVLPIVGTCFKKVYYDSLKGKVVSQFLSYDDVVVNAKAVNLKTARRVSHRIYKYGNYAVEMVNAGYWLDEDIGDPPADEFNDDDAPHLFIEQHCWLDLDDDGYDEPYVVTIHHETSKVMRIVARYDSTSLMLKAGALVRIEPIQYFVKYPFIPNPDGMFYDIGFGSLLYPINESINSAINQLLDSGTLANTGGGFLARGVKIRSGEIKFKPGEWKKTDVMGGDLKKGVLPLPIREPSQTLFQLLGLLITAGRDISSVQEAMSGTKPGENVSAATVVALIEQGLKVFSGIYKRIFRALTEELKLIYRLDGVYLEDKVYVALLDMDVTKEDFNPKDLAIVPNADPSFSLDSQRAGKADALMKISGRKGLNEDNITAYYLKAIKVPANMMTPPDQRQDPPPTIDEKKLDLEWAKFNLEKAASRFEIMKMFAEMEEILAKGVKHIADAEAQEEGLQIEQYRLVLEDLGKRMEAAKGVQENDRQGRVQSVVGQPPNPGGNEGS